LHQSDTAISQEAARYPYALVNRQLIRGRQRNAH